MKRFCLWLCRWSQLLCLFSPHANIRHRTRYDRNISYVVSAHIRRLRLVLLSSLVSIIHCVSVAQTIYFKMRKTNELKLLFSFNPFHVEWNKMSHFISQFQDLFFVSFFFRNWKLKSNRFLRSTIWRLGMMMMCKAFRVWLIEPQQQWICDSPSTILRWF